MHKKKKLREILLDFAFVGPAALFFVLIVIIPFFMGMGYSFTRWDGVSTKIDWNGINNFITISEDQTFIDAFMFTVKFTLAGVLITNLLAFTLAFLLTRSLKLTKVFRTIFFLPNVISGILLGFIWQFIFVKGFAAIGQATGWSFFNLPWLGDAFTGFWAIIIVFVWQSAGYFMIVYIAGFTNVPEDLIEAAKIDGANPFKMLTKITLPLIMPSITVCLFLSISNAFKMFDLNYALTGGGPFNSTRSVALDIYVEAFQNNSYGLGTAKALIFFLVVALITIIQVTVTKRMEVEA